jgi:hypothetical protein
VNGNDRVFGCVGIAGDEVYRATHPMLNSSVPSPR